MNHSCEPEGDSVLLPPPVSKMWVCPNIAFPAPGRTKTPNHLLEPHTFPMTYEEARVGKKSRAGSLAWKKRVREIVKDKARHES